MNTQNEKKQKNKNPNQIIADVPRLERDIYRVSKFANDKGTCYADVRVFYKKQDMNKFSGTNDRISIETTVLPELCEELMKAKMAPPLPMPTGKKRSEFKEFGEVRVSEKKLFRISKIQGAKYRKLRIQQFAVNAEGKPYPLKSKHLDIFEVCVEAVVQALRNSAFQAVTTESVAA